MFIQKTDWYVWKHVGEDSSKDSEAEYNDFRHVGSVGLHNHHKTHEPSVNQSIPLSVNICGY